MTTTVERRCVVTREREDRRGLVRLVRAPDGQVFCDYQGKLKGRGAWVSPSAKALAALEKSPGILYRPLKGACRTEGLLEQVRAANFRSLRELLSLCARAGLLVGGKDGVRSAMGGDRGLALILASDASARLVVDLKVRGDHLLVAQLPMDCNAIGQQIGKGPRSALVVLAGRPSRPLLRELRRWDALR